MFISIVVGFRNRDVAKVERSLISLSEQTFTAFELIFIDYGSNESVAEEICKLTERYNFVKYFYNETKGWFWNRAHALNIGTKYAKGDLILFYDIDLIIEKQFLEKISILNYNENFYTFSCFYLPAHFELQNRILEKDGIHYEQNYVGLCAVLKDKLESVNGFDEYYMVWGAEDDDLYRRLQYSGIEQIQFNAIDYLVFHQWHESQAPSKPSLWYLTMVDYLYRSQTKSTIINISGREIKKEDRLLLNAQGENLQGYKLINLENNPMLLFNPFMQEFHQMEPGEKGAIMLSFKVENQHRSFFGSIFSRNIKLSVKSNILFKKDITEFLQYFVGVHRSKFKDYFIEASEVDLNFYFIKN